MLNLDSDRFTFVKFSPANAPFLVKKARLELERAAEIEPVVNIAQRSLVDISGVGPKRAALLNSLGAKTIANFTSVPAIFLTPALRGVQIALQAQRQTW